MSAPGFTGAGLDRADHLRLDAERLADLVAHGDARLLQLDMADPVLDEHGALRWGPVDGGGELLFLGLEEGRPRFAPLISMETGQRAWGVFGLLALMSPKDAAIWGAARSLNEWHNRHGFCAACGQATAPFRAGWGRQCGGCGAEHFPRVDPVVIMLPIFGDRCLVGRQAAWPKGRMSALAGFVEPGETIEEACAREVKEEAGLIATRVTYFASQPWPFPSSLMIGLFAEVASDQAIADGTELEEVRWLTREEARAALEERNPDVLPPSPLGISRYLIEAWARGE